MFCSDEICLKTYDNLNGNEITGKVLLRNLLYKFEPKFSCSFECHHSLYSPFLLKKVGNLAVKSRYPFSSYLVPQTLISYDDFYYPSLLFVFAVSFNYSQILCHFFNHYSISVTMVFQILSLPQVILLHPNI